MFITFTCRRCSTELLDVELIEEKKLGRCQGSKLLFVLPLWDIPHFYLIPFLINKQYVEGEILRVIVFVYVFSFNLALTTFPMEVC